MSIQSPRLALSTSKETILALMSTELLLLLNAVIVEREMKTPEELADEWLSKEFWDAIEDRESSLAKKVFLAGYAAANRWISVEEELPIDTQVLVLYRRESNGFRFIGIDITSSYGDDKNDFWMHCENGDKVTHWQPIPAIPTEEIK